MQDTINKLIVKNKKIDFDNLTPNEKQIVEKLAHRIQQVYKIEFLSEDVVCCINRCKGDVCFFEQAIDDRTKMFKKHGGRAGWVLYKKLLNDEI